MLLFFGTPVGHEPFYPGVQWTPGHCRLDGNATLPNSQWEFGHRVPSGGEYIENSKFKAPPFRGCTKGTRTIPSGCPQRVEFDLIPSTFSVYISIEIW